VHFLPRSSSDPHRLGQLVGAEDALGNQDS